MIIIYSINFDLLIDKRVNIIRDDGSSLSFVSNDKNDNMENINDSNCMKHTYSAFDAVLYTWVSSEWNNN